MRFKPMTDDEIKAASNDFSIPLPIGTYEGTVIEAEDAVDKKGRDMMKLKINVSGRHIYDYISPHWMQYKWKHFFKSAGKMEYYEKGEVSAEDVLHWPVLAILEIQKSEGYPDKNAVYDYVLESEVEGVMNRGEAVKVVESSDGLPF